MAAFSLSTLKRGLLLFWALWHTIVCLINLCDARKALGILPDGWGFASGNWDFMRSVTAVDATPHALVALIFAGEAVAAALFWRAFGAGFAASISDRRSRRSSPASP